MTKAEKFDRLLATPALRQDLRGKTVRAAAYTGTASAMDFVLRIASTAVLARLLLPEHFGLVMMVTAITTVADQLRDFGLSAAVVQKKTITHEEVSSLFWINLATGTAIAALISAAAPLIAHYYREPQLIPLTCALSTTFIFSGALAQHQALLTRQLKLGHTSAVRLFSSIFSTVLAIVLAWSGFGFWSLVWREIARAALLAVGMWFCLPWVPSLPRRHVSVRSLLGFGANLTAANIIASLSAAADRLLLGRFLGAAPVGIFRQAHQLMSAPTDQLVSPIYQAAQPGLSLLQSDPARYRQMYQKMVTMVCLLTMPLSLFSVVYASELTAVLLGDKWLAAAPLLAIFGLSAFAKQAIGTTMQILISLGRTRELLYLSIAQNVVLVSFMAIGIRWGLHGVAIAEVLTTYLVAIPRLHFTFKHSPVTLGTFYSAAFRPLSASLVMAACLFGIHAWTATWAPAASLALGCVVALILFGSSWTALPGGKAELQNLLDDVRSSLLRRPSRRPDPLEASPAASAS